MHGKVKRRLLARIFGWIKIWQLVILLVVATGISVELLRQNNLTMILRRSAVIEADTKGDSVKIAQTLSDLRQYVMSHMNTDMGNKGIYLQQTYQKAYETAIQAGVANDTTGHSIYNQADAECQATFNKTYSFPAYTQCVAGKLANLSSHDPLSEVHAPPVDLYRYTFVSPLWTPDAAGISVVVASVILLVLLWKIILVVAVQLLSRYRLSHRKLT